MIEDVGTGMIQILQSYATEKRIALITGKANTTYLKEFKGTDLSNINRVRITVGNALAKTIAGRTEIATNLLQMGMVKTPEQFMTVLNTGRIDPLFEGDQKQLILIQKENEWLMEGQIPAILETDWHMTHINEHQAVLADPAIRMNQELVDIVMTHIKGHYAYLTGGAGNDPGFLAALGQQPIAPPQMAPMNGMTPPPGPQPGNAVEAQQGQDLAATMSPPVSGDPNIKLPEAPPMPPTAGQIAGQMNGTGNTGAPTG